jgi:peroxiredoxin
MNRQWMIVLGVIAALGGGAYALVRFGPENTGIEIGKKAPDYRLIDLATGDSVSLRALAKGEVTLINIWATWCAPCKEEMPAMQRTYADLAPRGFRILAVSIDNGDGAAVRKFADELGITFDILQDRSGNIQQLYQTTGVPESFLLDRDGTIVKRVIGAHDWASGANRRLIGRYLGGVSVSVTPATPPVHN